MKDIVREIGMTEQHYVIKDGMIHIPLTGGDGLTTPLTSLGEICSVMNAMASQIKRLEAEHSPTPETPKQ